MKRPLPPTKEWRHRRQIDAILTVHATAMDGWLWNTGFALCKSRKNWNRKADVRRIQVLCARFRLWGQGILLPSASAASVERLNSVATDMMTRKRNRLSALRAEKMMLLRAWMLFDFELTKKL